MDFLAIIMSVFSNVRNSLTVRQSNYFWHSEDLRTGFVCVCVCERERARERERERARERERERERESEIVSVDSEAYICEIQSGTTILRSWYCFICINFFLMHYTGHCFMIVNFIFFLQHSPQLSKHLPYVCHHSRF